MIRTSKHSLKFSNKLKLQYLNQLFIDYEKDLKSYVELILKEELPLNLNLSSKYLPSLKINHSQYKQIIYKNASEIVRSNIDYQKNKAWKKYKKCYKYFIDKNRQMKRFSDLKINYLKRIKIDIKNISINIDSRLFDIEKGNYFNEFIHLRLPYFIEGKKRTISINLPIQHHMHSLKYRSWSRANTVNLEKINGNFYISYFWKKDISQKIDGDIVGIDIGYNKLISDSNGNHYGENLKEIYNKLAKKKRGSKSYNQLLRYRTNLVNQVVNKFINSYNLKDLVVEDLKNLRNKSKLSRKILNKMQYFIYSKVIEKLKQLSDEKGFQIHFVDPAYTSQTCPKCQQVDKKNRNLEHYNCECGYSSDADTTGAINVLSRFSEESIIPLLEKI